MIPLSELEKLRIGCERGNIKQVSATEFLSLFEHFMESHKDTERLHKLQKHADRGRVLIEHWGDLRLAIDSLKKD